MAASFIIPGVLSLFVLVSGILLTGRGRPYPTALFTLHKLLALAATVTASLRLASLVKDHPVGALATGLMVLAGLCVVLLFASGALLSLERLPSPVFRIIHTIVPGVLVSALILLIYLVSMGF
jgi:hypothetical protein